MRITFYLRSRIVQCRHGGCFPGSAHSLRAALRRLRDSYTQKNSARDGRGPRRSIVPARGDDHA